MNEHLMTCSICGQRFNPQARGICSGCPLNNGCQLVCCPNCGFQTVNTNESHLARMATKLFSRQWKDETLISRKNDKQNRET